MGLADLSPLQVDRLSKLKYEFPYFARHVLKIRDKEGVVRPLILNKSQIHVHNFIEKQRQETGRVRVIIVKARQVGISTSIEGRFYWKNWGTNKSLRAFILTHEQPATDNLFGMVSRFHTLHPEEYVKPPLKTGNAKELIFGHNDSGYQVATAGTKETGRSATFQLFHGSEVALWPNAQELAAGAFNTIGDTQGTEIILESTGKGVSGFFYNTAQAAIRGKGEYRAIFIPWFWDEQYQRPCPDGWNPGPAWMAYAQQHSLTWEQLYWAYTKSETLGSAISASPDEPCWLFKQEYPATFDEAFQSSGNSFIPATSVLRARKPKEPVIGSGPVILGVDPARSGDKVGIIDRCGRRAGERICERMDPGGSVTYVAARVMAIIDRIRPDLVNIDVGSNGAGVYDILCDNGYGGIVNAINFGSNPITRGPTGDDLYFNRRAEMHDLGRIWFEQELPVQIPDDDSLQGDLCAAQWGPGATRYNTSNELIIEEKSSIKLRLGASPDLSDAFFLTFAIPVANSMRSGQTSVRERRSNRRSGY